MEFFKRISEMVVIAMLFPYALTDDIYDNFYAYEEATDAINASNVVPEYGFLTVGITAGIFEEATDLINHWAGATLAQQEEITEIYGFDRKGFREAQGPLKVLQRKAHLVQMDLMGLLPEPKSQNQETQLNDMKKWYYLRQKEQQAQAKQAQQAQQ